MNKSAGVLLGFVVVVGALSTAGAWYTGNQLEGVLNSSIQDANAQLKTSMSSGGASASIELVSLERNLFTSTAHYRLKLQNLQLRRRAAVRRPYRARPAAVVAAQVVQADACVAQQQL